MQLKLKDMQIEMLKQKKEADDLLMQHEAMKKQVAREQEKQRRIVNDVDGQFIGKADKRQ